MQVAFFGGCARGLLVGDVSAEITSADVGRELECFIMVKGVL